MPAEPWSTKKVRLRQSYQTIPLAHALVNTAKLTGNEGNQFLFRDWQHVILPNHFVAATGSVQPASLPRKFEAQKPKRISNRGGAKLVQVKVAK